MTAREEYVAGLRMLADLLEQHDDLPLPYYGVNAEVRLPFYCYTRDQIAQFARLLPGRVDKHVDEEYESYGFSLRGALAGLHVDVKAHRNAVCERVVVGTDEVTEQVPDPSVQVPLVEVTKTVERVRWECSPLLAGTDPAPAGETGLAARLGEGQQ